MMRVHYYSKACFLVILHCLIGLSKVSRGQLTKNFYGYTCPLAEAIAKQITWSRAAVDPTLGAKLIRLHFHDCFVRGCDASLLLDRTGTDLVEKDAAPNQSVSGYELIDEIKSQLEDVCEGVVSCADIAALAARDAVSFPFGRNMWAVLTGRRDGTISRAEDTTDLPPPTADFTTLEQMFANKGLTVEDLVALSGAHTIGISHCGAFSPRLYNFTTEDGIDPSLDKAYAEYLKLICPLPINPDTTVEMDPQSSLDFDSNYFDVVTSNKGLFQSDAALLTDTTSAEIVDRLRDQAVFFAEFAKSMVKMGGIEVLTGTDGEIRQNCRFVNPVGHSEI